MLTGNISRTLTENVSLHVIWRRFVARYLERFCHGARPYLERCCHTLPWTALSHVIWKGFVAFIMRWKTKQTNKQNKKQLVICLALIWKGFLAPFEWKGSATRYLERFCRTLSGKVLSLVLRKGFVNDLCPYPENCCHTLIILEVLLHVTWRNVFARFLERFCYPS